MAKKFIDEVTLPLEAEQALLTLKKLELDIWTPMGGLQGSYFIAGYEHSLRRSYGEYVDKDEVIERGSADEGEQILEADARFRPGEVWRNHANQRWMIQDRHDVAVHNVERARRVHNLKLSVETELKGMAGRVYLRFVKQDSTLGDRYIDVPVLDMIDGRIDALHPQKNRPPWTYDVTAGGLRRQCGECGLIKTFPIDDYKCDECRTAE